MKRYISIIYGIVLAGLTFSLSHCVDKGKSVSYAPIEVKVIISNPIDEKNIQSEIISFIKPILSTYCGDTAFLGYDKYLHLIRLNPDSSLTKFDIKANQSVTDVGALGSESLESKSANIDKYFADPEVPNELALTKTLSKEAYLYVIRKYLSENQGVVPLIYSKDLVEKDYLGIQVFNSIDSLKSAMALKACKGTAEKFVILYKPALTPASEVDPFTQVDTTSNPTIDQKLRLVLLQIINRNLSFEERHNNAEEAMKSTFSKDLVVETYINKAGIASHLFDKGFGFQYLETLTTDKSIKDFVILAHKDSFPNVSFLQVIEIHK